MVASIAALKHAVQASTYYELDDYYSEDDQAPSAWFGRAAGELGLSGAVDRDQFAGLLNGKLRDGRRLGTMRAGQLEHRPGWDITYSAPKSVSIMAEIAGDRRLVDAHDAAVRTALGYVERHAIATRIRSKSGIETVTTAKAAVATFRHNTSRALDPQLHTHGVVLNATQAEDGQWRSLESHPLFQAYKDSGAIYRQALATQARTLGYELREGRDSMFELACVPAEVVQAFSTRGAQIEEQLVERGKTRATASAGEKATLALATRSKKIAAERGALVTAWREQASTIGFGTIERCRIVNEATNCAMISPDSAKAIRAIADRAVAIAASGLSERDAVFSVAQLERSAGEFAFGRAKLADITAAANRAENAGDLIGRSIKTGSRVANGYTTKRGVEVEQRMLHAEARQRCNVQPAFSRIEASRFVARAEIAAADRGHKWNDQQRAATRGLLMSTSGISGVQGLAGTAKTTTVLFTFAAGMRDQGYNVRAFAPTAAAAEELGKAIDAEAQTIALLRVRGEAIVKDAARGREVWIVDEASMVSAADMDRVLDLATRVQARVVLVGDVRQLGSVEAGRAFGQLQEAGMETMVLDQIVRQTNGMTKEAVEATIACDAKRAFAALNAGGGYVVEIANGDDRYAAIATDYARLTPEERARTIVLDPSRVGRERLTDAIRSALVEDGSLGKEVLHALTLEPRRLTKTEAEHARSYSPGDIVTFRRSFKARNVFAGQGYCVAAVDVETNRIELRDTSGRAIDWQLERWGRGQAEAYTETEREFRVGDRVQFTRNDHTAGRTNGRDATIIALDPGARTITTGSGKGRQTLNLNQTRDRHIRHGWVKTIYSSQSATADRVFAHLESFRANTVNARSAYVAISRARRLAAIFTDNEVELTEALNVRSGDKQASIDDVSQFNPLSMIKMEMEISN